MARTHYVLLLLVVARSLQAGRLPAPGSTTPSPSTSCGGHLCSGFQWVPVATGSAPGLRTSPTRFSALFDVPSLPLAANFSDPDFCHYIYFNIFFPNFQPSPWAVYNQFVPQLMLGDALSTSSMAPAYTPGWGNFTTYVFSAQYFFALPAADNSSAFIPKAATGAIFPTVPGETLWTSMELDIESWAWTLSMGVVGDAARTSTVSVPQPFMGLLEPHTQSWSEATYSAVHVNSCWELYGVDSAGDWPSSGSSYTMRIDTALENSIPWKGNWSGGGVIDCPGAPTINKWSERHNGTSQEVGWTLGWK